MSENPSFRVTSFGKTPRLSNQLSMKDQAQLIENIPYYNTKDFRGCKYFNF